MEDKIIYVDPNDWSTIEDAINQINEVGCMQFGTTENGEDIIFNVGMDSEGNDFLITETYQSNGWIRKNIYNPQDYSIEELYERA